MVGLSNAIQNPKEKVQIWNVFGQNWRPFCQNSFKIGRPKILGIQMDSELEWPVERFFRIFFLCFVFHPFRVRGAPTNLTQ